MVLGLDPRASEESKQRKFNNRIKNLLNCVPYGQSYLHALKIGVKELIDEIWRNIRLFLCRHCSLKQPWRT